MSERIERAIELHHSKCNCSQALAMAYCDLFGVEEKEAFRAMEAFGVGMGSLTTCGAVSAMAYLTGLKMSDVNLAEPATKTICYKIAKAMNKEFIAKNKSLICKELKGIGTGIVLRDCDGCIEDAAALVEKILLAEDPLAAANASLAITSPPREPRPDK